MRGIERENLKLKKQRLLRAWTQEDMSARLGIDARTVRRWESGAAHPRAYLVQKLAELFDTTPEELGFAVLDEDPDPLLETTILDFSEPIRHSVPFAKGGVNIIENLNDSREEEQRSPLNNSISQVKEEEKHLSGPSGSGLSAEVEQPSRDTLEMVSPPEVVGAWEKVVSVSFEQRIRVILAFSILGLSILYIVAVIVSIFLAGQLSIALLAFSGIVLVLPFRNVTQYYFPERRGEKGKPR